MYCTAIPAYFFVDYSCCAYFTKSLCNILLTVPTECIWSQYFVEVLLIMATPSVQIYKYYAAKHNTLVCLYTSFLFERMKQYQVNHRMCVTVHIVSQYLWTFYRPWLRNILYRNTCVSLHELWLLNPFHYNPCVTFYQQFSPNILYSINSCQYIDCVYSKYSITQQYLHIALPAAAML